jgi:hypothetical protein
MVVFLTGIHDKPSKRHGFNSVLTTPGTIEDFTTEQHCHVGEDHFSCSLCLHPGFVIDRPYITTIIYLIPNLPPPSALPTSDKHHQSIINSSSTVYTTEPCLHGAPGTQPPWRDGRFGPPTVGLYCGDRRDGRFELFRGPAPCKLQYEERNMSSGSLPELFGRGNETGSWRAIGPFFEALRGPPPKKR